MNPSLAHLGSITYIAMGPPRRILSDTHLSCTSSYAGADEGSTDRGGRLFFEHFSLAPCLANTASAYQRREGRSTRKCCDYEELPLPLDETYE